VCARCKGFVEAAEVWAGLGAAFLALAGFIWTAIAALASAGRREGFGVFIFVGVIWLLLGFALYAWLYGVLGLNFVRPIDKGEYLRFLNTDYQKEFDRRNPAPSRRAEGYVLQYFLYLVYLIAAVYIPFWGVFFFLATMWDGRRLVMKWVVLAVSLAVTGLNIYLAWNHLGWWFPWPPFK
jgi:hypothetical protein